MSKIATEWPRAGRPAGDRPGPIPSPRLSRRNFLKASGVLLVGFNLAGSAPLLGAPVASAQPPAPAPRVDAFLAIAEDGSVTLFTGRVDIGTGIKTALAQIAADELEVQFERVTVVQGDSALTPDQGPTVASISISRGGSEIRRAAAEARQALLGLASERLGIAVDQLSARNGAVSVQADPSRQVSYGELIGGRRFELEVTGSAPLKSPADYTIVGRSIPRVDIPGKVTGQFQYVQDVRVPGMLHGRAVRPAPQSGATLVGVDESSVADVPGLVKVVVQGSFVGVVAEREEQAIRAARQLKVTWSDPAGIPGSDDPYATVRATPSTDRELAAVGDVQAALAGAARTFSATYEFPYQIHGMIGPDCAVADVREGQVTV